MQRMLKFLHATIDRVKNLYVKKVYPHGFSVVTEEQQAMITFIFPDSFLMCCEAAGRQACFYGVILLANVESTFLKRESRLI